jgi:hypothetical protein
MTTPVNVLQVPVPTRFPAGATPEGDGVEVGSGPVPVDAYVDFQCPFCRQFEEHSAAAINELIANDLITLVYHPLSFLDRLSTTRYSSRATSASGCAADGGRFREYSLALFANQPPEGGPGLSDEQLVEVDGPSASATISPRACSSTATSTGGPTTAPARRSAASPEHPRCTSRGPRCCPTAVRSPQLS